jgi:hypothetical protein
MMSNPDRGPLIPAGDKVPAERLDEVLGALCGVVDPGAVAVHATLHGLAGLRAAKASGRDAVP